MEKASGSGVPNTTNAALIVSPEKCAIMPNVKESFDVRITNVSFETLLFRLLTTNPQRYLVRPRKGVLKPNASVGLTVTLNREEFKRNPSAFGTQDDFRVDYCVMHPGDVIEPRDSNVPQIIKTRKREAAGQVHHKRFCCRVDAPPAASQNAAKNDARNSPAALAVNRQRLATPESPANTRTSSGGSRMTSRQLEASTLAEKNKRQVVEQQKAMRKKAMVVMAVALIVLLIGLWFGVY